MTVFRKMAMATIAMAAAAMPLQSASAATFTFDLTGLQTFDQFLDASNFVTFIDIGAGTRVTGLTYSITIATIGASRRSDAAIAFSDSAITAGVQLNAGFADPSPGTTTYTDTADLVAQGLDFAVGVDGLLRLELFEDLDNVANAADANLGGFLTFEYTPASATVPEPATWAMLVGGFAMTGAALRRRRTVRVSFGS